MVEEGCIIVWTTHLGCIEIILETSVVGHYRSIDFDQLEQVWYISQKYAPDADNFDLADKVVII